MNSVNRWICGALMLVVLPSSSEAAKAWLAIESPHFTVISSENEGRSRDIAWQFEQIRAVVETLWPWARVETDRPVMILAVSDEESMKALAPYYWEQNGRIHPSSVFVQAPERYYIALRTDVGAGDRDGTNPYFAAYRSYMSLTLDASTNARLPLWFANGVAGVMANTLVRANEVQVGRVFPSHLRQLRQGSRLPLRQLIAADDQSSWYTDPARRYTFDSECALLLHMLLFADQSGQRAKRVDAFASLLSQGTSPVAAFEESFGPPDGLDGEFAKYLASPILSYRRVSFDLRVKREGWQTRPLSLAQTSASAAAFHLAMGRLAEAAAEIQQARGADPSLAMTTDVEGALFERTREPEKARAAFEKAVGAGSTNFYTYYRLAAMLSPDASRETVTRIESLLERSVSLNNAYTPTQIMLSNVMAQLGRPDAALNFARRAVALDPNGFSAQYALARALSAGAQFAEALRESRHALAVATNDPEKQAATNLLQRIIADAVARVPPPPSSPPPPAGAVRVGGAIKTPVKIKDVRPIYPDLAAAAQVQGVVILEVTVEPGGKVIDVRLLRSIPLLDAAATAAVRQWEYEPTLVDGVAVPIIIAVTLNFAVQ